MMCSRTSKWFAFRRYKWCSSFWLANDFVSFDSDGFTVGTFENFNTPNNVLSNPVAWNWKADGAGVTNGDGTITFYGLSEYDQRV
jgi:hypothetical protein